MIISYYMKLAKNGIFKLSTSLFMADWSAKAHKWNSLSMHGHGHERRLKVPLFPPQNVIDLCKCWKHFIKYDNNDRHVQWESDKPEEYTTGRLASIFSSSWEFSALSCFRVFDRAAKSPNTSTASLAVPFLNKQNKSRLIYTRSN